jgi:hypothetical protein
VLLDESIQYWLIPYPTKFDSLEVLPLYILTIELWVPVFILAETLTAACPPKCFSLFENALDPDEQDLSLGARAEEVFTCSLAGKAPLLSTTCRSEVIEEVAFKASERS